MANVLLDMAGCSLPLLEWELYSNLTQPGLLLTLVIYKPRENSIAAHSMECFKEKSLTEKNYVLSFRDKQT